MIQTDALDRFWQTYQDKGYFALIDSVPCSALEAFYLSLLAFGHDDFEPAVRHMQRAAGQEPDDPVFAAALTYLQRVVQNGKAAVYNNPEAFAAYVSGGGNVPLYQKVSAALRQYYQGYNGLRLLDVGVGDGLALLPALTDNISHLTLVEPSQALLPKTIHKLAGRGIGYQAYAESFQEFICHPGASYDIAQATFSLQSIAPHERKPLLRWFHTHCERLLLVEFDVPQFEHMYQPAHVCSVLDRFQKGLAEYGEERDMVAQGFMMPVMFGFFDQSASRINYEQPLRTWLAQIKDAGFSQVEEHILYDYWWSPAFLIDARL